MPRQGPVTRSVAAGHPNAFSDRGRPGDCFAEAAYPRGKQGLGAATGKRGSDGDPKVCVKLRANRTTGQLSPSSRQSCCEALLDGEFALTQLGLSQVADVAAGSKKNRFAFVDITNKGRAPQRQPSVKVRAECGSLFEWR